MKITALSLSLTLLLAGTALTSTNGWAGVDMDRLNQKMFETIYRLNVWGHKESRSGPGSSMEQTEKIRTWLPNILKSFNVRLFLDAPCGDFNWCKELNLDFLERYIGIDIVPDVVMANLKSYANEKRVFLHKDITKDSLPRADAIMCRDCFAHLSFSDIWSALKNFKKTGAKYLIASTYPNRSINVDIQGANLMHLLRFRPLNLQAAPFNFPQPKAILLEENTEGNGHIADKSIAVWEINDLPIPD